MDTKPAKLRIYKVVIMFSQVTVPRTKTYLSIDFSLSLSFSRIHTAGRWVEQWETLKLKLESTHNPSMLNQIPAELGCWKNFPLQYFL